MTAALKYAALEASRARRSTSDVTTERRPMPTHSKRLGRLTDFVSGGLKPWLVVKVREIGFGMADAVGRLVISSHDSQDLAEHYAGRGRDALTDAEVGEGFNVVAERRPKGKR